MKQNMKTHSGKIKQIFKNNAIKNYENFDKILENMKEKFQLNVSGGTKSDEMSTSRPS
jgi:hypothetical protein